MLETRLNCVDDAFEVRRHVFMEEQGYENEFDEIDDSCTHVTLYSDDELVGCARVYPEFAGSGVYFIGRIAVLPEYRSQGFGTELVCAAEDVARDLGAEVVRLHAQEYIVKMYERCGYTRMGSVDYEDEGQPHVWMEKLVDATESKPV